MPSDVFMVTNPAPDQLNRETEVFLVPARASENGLGRNVRQSRQASTRSFTP